MRADVFTGKQLAQVSSDNPVRLSILGMDDAAFMLTSISGGVRPNYQLLHTFGPEVYMNVFSMRLSLFQLVGVHVVSTCISSAGAAATVKAEPAFMTFYKRNQIITGKPVEMAFSGLSMLGYLTELELKDYSQSGTGLDGYSFTMGYLGKFRNLDYLGEAGSDGAASSPASAGGAGSTAVDPEAERLYQARLRGRQLDEQERQRDQRRMNDQISIYNRFSPPGTPPFPMFVGDNV